MNNTIGYDVTLNSDTAIVFTNGKEIGTILFSLNPCHRGHFYLKLQLQEYDTDCAKDIFSILRQKLNKPLQVMISSNEQNAVSFLDAAGFSCVRKCYEVKASAQDYIGEKSRCSVSLASAGSWIYTQCCEIMLDRYITTHKQINPWTGSSEQFIDILPKTVYYEPDNQQIANFAFVEDNEIAYVCGKKRSAFTFFAQNLIAELFGKYEYVCFEADDCDEYAMELKALFINQSNESFDTYIL